VNVFVITGSSPPVIISLQAFEPRLAVGIRITISLTFLAPIVFRTIVILRPDLLDYVRAELRKPIGCLRLDGLLAALCLNFFSILTALREGTVEHSNAPVVLFVRNENKLLPGRVEAFEELTLVALVALVKSI